MRHWWRWRAYYTINRGPAFRLGMVAAAIDAARLTWRVRGVGVQQ